MMGHIPLEQYYRIKKEQAEQNKRMAKAFDAFFNSLNPEPKKDNEEIEMTEIKKPRK